MRWNHITRVRAAMLAGVLLFGPRMPIAWAQAESTPRAALLSPSAQASARLLLDDGVADVVVSEVIVLLVGIVGCGLLVGGMETLDLWRERRE